MSSTKVNEPLTRASFNFLCRIYFFIKTKNFKPELIKTKILSWCGRKAWPTMQGISRAEKSWGMVRELTEAILGET
jgi:hypothetical protein